MMPTEAQSAEDIFLAAIELPPEKQIPYVDGQCGRDDQLRDEVARLLTSHAKNEDGGFILDRPILDEAPRADLAEIAEKEGDTIGRYRLLERIGEGGMGVVYMAEQLEGVRRQVALKILKLGMDTRQVVARFEAERQAMAIFDHPGIARVLDAGSTQTGRPYFVMELVRGTNISSFVNRSGLALNERLALFMSVCNAVQHAHEKGIIHRDLKPSNLLVTQFDGVPVAKVIDFGIAKAIGYRLTDKTLFTRYASMIGTPEYMSPEQTELNGLNVDTRSDIYSLGVVLYELITGSTPLAEQKLKQLNPLALMETLRDAEIETPSTRLGKAADQATVASVSLTKVRGELDWIVMKALSRDRSLRYASANEMAADVGRYLSGDPVDAAPPSRFYRVSSYLRKHKTATITAATVSLLLMTATIACSVFAINSHRANGALSIVNDKLTANVERLETAEKELRDGVTGKLYGSAHSIALARFDMEIEDEMVTLAERLFNLDGLPGSTSESDFNEFGFCFEFNRHLLLDLKHQSLLQKSLQRIDVTITAEMEFVDRVYESTVGFSDGESEDHEHSPECLALQAEFEKSLRKHRPHFYRLLVAEYRRAFGARDIRVADALDMLSASLMETGEPKEAEAHLRESLALRALESDGQATAGATSSLLKLVGTK